MAHLVIDIGNTRVKAGIFQEKKLLHQTEIDVSDPVALPQLLRAYAVTDVLFASVGDPAWNPRSEAEAAGAHCTELLSDTPLPFVNTYHTPATLGKDRLAAVAGAQALFPASDCMVIDAGTCIKYEILSASGRYLGGNIAPGLRMRARAMHDYTARLPEAPLGLPDHIVGYSTETALQNGAFLGALLEIIGFVQLYSTKFEVQPRIIFTGGDAEFLFPRFSFPGQVLAPDLVLTGLNEILAYNKLIHK